MVIKIKPCQSKNIFCARHKKINYKNCLEATQIDNEINQLEKK